MIENGFITRDELLGGTGFERRWREYVLPNGKKLLLGSLNERERMDLDTRIKIKKGQATPESLRMVRVRLIVAMCFLPNKSDRLFRREDEQSLLSWDSAIIEDLYEVCQEHCGISDQSVEDLEKNFERVPVSSSLDA